MYFDEYSNFPVAKQKRKIFLYKLKKLFFEDYNYNDWFKKGDKKEKLVDTKREKIVNIRSKERDDIPTMPLF